MNKLFGNNALNWKLSEIKILLDSYKTESNNLNGSRIIWRQRKLRFL